MRRARWLAPWKDSLEKPAIYHCVSRVVDRRFVFGEEEREKFRILMRKYESFSGCRALAYCVMSNHFHLLLEVPPMPQGGLSDEQLLERLRAIYQEGVVEEVAKQLQVARAKNMTTWAQQIHQRYEYRMHDLSQFMKTLLQCMTCWFNRRHERKGTLWEERYRSVIVEDGIAARMISAYIDLNPVRAGMVKDPAEYRWSSYGEALGCGDRKKGKKAREGLVRACTGHKGVGFEEEKWQEVEVMYRRLLGMALRRKGGALSENVAKERTSMSSMGEKSAVQSDDIGSGAEYQELRLAEKLGYRMRYFTAGAVIGSRSFVNEVFMQARERFSAKRKDGARALKGLPQEARGLLWSMRDLRQPMKK
jgi:REP element-mobilizing transposase RayT